MKRLIALLLTLALAVSVALPVMAEEAAPRKASLTYDDNMTVEIVIPDGYTVEEFNAQGSLMMVLAPIDEANGYYCTIIAPDEDRADVARLNDLTDEQIQEIVDEFVTDLNNPTVKFAETGMGTKLIIIDDNDVDGADTAVVVTLYKGYFLTTYVFPAGDTVTEAELQTAIQFYTDMAFVE